jgi:hypothetical protein
MADAPYHAAHERATSARLGYFFFFLSLAPPPFPSKPARTCFALFFWLFTVHSNSPQPSRTHRPPCIMHVPYVIGIWIFL